MRRLIAVIASVPLAACVMGIPDAGPAPPPKPEPRQVWVRIDNGPWRCYARERVRRDLCKITGSCSP